MAFFGIFLMYILLLLVLAFVCLCTLIGVIVLISSAVSYGTYRKKLNQGIPVKNTYVKLRTVGLICMIPAILTLSFVVYSVIYAGIDSFIN